MLKGFVAHAKHLTMEIKKAFTFAANVKYVYFPLKPCMLVDFHKCFLLDHLIIWQLYVGSDFYSYIVNTDSRPFYSN